LSAARLMRRLDCLQPYYWDGGTRAYGRRWWREAEPGGIGTGIPRAVPRDW